MIFNSSQKLQSTRGLQQRHCCAIL